MENITLKIKDNQVEFPVRELDGQRVVTLKDIDMVHGRPDGTAKRNFGKNKHRLIENEDFFEITQWDKNCPVDEFRTRPRDTEKFQVGAIDKMYLLTESGYLMLVKSFNDDLAWEVQRQLVKGYFRSRQSSILNLLTRQCGQDEALRLGRENMMSLQVRRGFLFHDNSMAMMEEMAQAFEVPIGWIRYPLEIGGYITEKYIPSHTVGKNYPAYALVLTDKGKEIGEEIINERRTSIKQLYSIRFKKKFILEKVDFHAQGFSDTGKAVYDQWLQEAGLRG